MPSTHSVGYQPSIQTRVYPKHTKVPLATLANSVTAKAYPSAERVTKFIQTLPLFQPQTHLTVKMVMGLLGMMTSCIAIVSPACLHMLPLQHTLQSQCSPAKGHLQELVLVGQQLIALCSV